ncbi:MAG: pilus assembly protein TadG-related protein [Gemmataceae bacterium]
MNRNNANPQRRGAIMPLMAVLMVPILGVVAFVVDIGFLTVTQSELQNTADAASLAGVHELMDPYALWAVAPSQTQKNKIRGDAIIAARRTAKNFAQLNQAGEVSQLNLRDDDIEVGRIDANGNYDPNPPQNLFPNSVRVRVRRDSLQNSPVETTFSKVIGVNNVELAADARATIYTGHIQGFQPVPGVNARLLPVAYDVMHWQNFLQTGGAPGSGGLTDADGNPVLRAYPASDQYRGNFGLLNLTNAKKQEGASTVWGWIRDGLTASEIQSLVDKGNLPLTGYDPNLGYDPKGFITIGNISVRVDTAWNWYGEVGFQASTVMEINNYTGDNFIMPLFRAYNSTPGNSYTPGPGSGTNVEYNIVSFVSVKLMPTNDKNKEIIIQPSGYVDPSLYFLTNSIKPAGTDTSSGPPVITFAAPKLTQ